MEGLLSMMYNSNYKSANYMLPICPNRAERDAIANGFIIIIFLNNRISMKIMDLSCRRVTIRCVVSKYAQQNRISSFCGHFGMDNSI